MHRDIHAFCCCRRVRHVSPSRSLALYRIFRAPPFQDLKYFAYWSWTRSYIRLRLKPALLWRVDGLVIRPRRLGIYQVQQSWATMIKTSSFIPLSHADSVIVRLPNL
jgi:hypothetical protein